MTSNQILTSAAVAFGAYALWFVNRTPGKVVATQPAQQQRDKGLTDFLHIWDSSTAALMNYGRDNGQQVVDYTGVGTGTAQDSATLNSLYGAAGYG